MADVNRVILAGRLTRDPELRHTPNNTPVCDMGLAITERFKAADGEWQERPVFVDITVWGRSAENCDKYLNKGRSVLVEGRLRYDSWEKEGQKRSRLSVTADRVHFLDWGDKGSESSGGTDSSPNPAMPSFSPSRTTPAPPPPSGQSNPTPVADPDVAADDEVEDLPF